jgi:Uma2 family endonuclease
VLHGEGGFILSRNPDTVLAPHVTVVAESVARQLDIDSDRFVSVVPAIVIEVKSPSDREPDIARKLAVYLTAGVQLIWSIRPANRGVAEHRPDGEPRFLGVTDALVCEDILPGFRMEISALSGE